jgi:hypothetical protein
MEIALIAVCISIPFFCLFSFREGLKYGGAKVEKIEPVKAIRKTLKDGKETKEANRKMEELSQIMRNLSVFKGTNEGQVKIGGKK